MRESDAGALRAYLKMIMDGSAFDRWGETPERSLRNRIVEGILRDKGISYSDTEKLRAMKKYVQHIKPEKVALEKAIDEFMIKENDFKV